MMGYDYRVGGSQPGASAPLARRDGSEQDARVVARPVPRRGRPAGADDPRPAALRRRLAGHRPEIGARVDGPRRDLGPAPEPGDDRSRPKPRPAYDAVEDVAVLTVPDGEGWQVGLLRHPDQPHAEARPGRSARPRRRRLLGRRLRARAARYTVADRVVPSGPAGDDGALGSPHVDARDPRRASSAASASRSSAPAQTAGTRSGPQRTGSFRSIRTAPWALPQNDTSPPRKLRRTPMAPIQVNGPSIRYCSMFATAVRIRNQPKRISRSSPTSA